MTAELKTVLVDALNAANLRPDHGEVVYIGDIAQPLITTKAPNGYLAFPFNADRLATVVRDHALMALADAMLVKATLQLPDEALPKCFADCLDGVIARKFEAIDGLRKAGRIPANDVLDRLIEGLAGPKGGVEPPQGEA